VFHCVVHPDAVAKLTAAQKQKTTSPPNTATTTSDRLSPLPPPQSTSASAISTGIQTSPLSVSQLLRTTPPPTHQHHNIPLTSQQRHDVSSPNIPPHTQQPHSIQIQGQSTQTHNTQAAYQQTITQLTAQPPIRPNIQVLPIQYQAILIKCVLLPCPYSSFLNSPLTEVVSLRFTALPSYSRSLDIHGECS
jgi:hypothetical protein